MHGRVIYLAGALGAVLLATLACQISTGGRVPPTRLAPDSTDTVEDLEKDWESALRTAAETGQFTLTINEDQLSSLVAKSLEESEEALLTQPAVFLRDGQIQIYGQAEQSPVTARFYAAITPVISPGGQLSLEVTLVEVGPIPAPDFIQRRVSTFITRAFEGILGPNATRIHFLSFNVDDGLITIVGEIR